MREFGRQAMAFITRIGADPGDPVELRLRKALLVTVALMVLPAGVIWGALYWVAGEPTAALLPWTYFVGSLLSLAAFHLARSFVLLRRAQLLLILLVPFLLTLALGGLPPSRAVSGGGVSLPPFALLAPSARQREDAQQKADGLLLNILPPEIAELLKADSRQIAEQFDEASVLFADVVDLHPPP